LDYFMDIARGFHGLDKPGTKFQKPGGG